MDWQPFSEATPGTEATIAHTDDDFIISAHLLNDRGQMWGYSIVGVPDPLRSGEKQIFDERREPKQTLAEVQAMTVELYEANRWRRKDIPGVGVLFDLQNLDLLKM